MTCNWSTGKESRLQWNERQTEKNNTTQQPPRETFPIVRSIFKKLNRINLRQNKRLQAKKKDNTKRILWKKRGELKNSFSSRSDCVHSGTWVTLTDFNFCFFPFPSCLLRKLGQKTSKKKLQSISIYYDWLCHRMNEIAASLQRSKSRNKNLFNWNWTSTAQTNIHWTFLIKILPFMLLNVHK